MTNRENFFSLIRRQGYEYVPVEFVLSPYLENEVKERLGANDYEEYFKFPWRRVDDIRLVNHNVDKYWDFFEPPLKEGSDIDQWGVGHETSPNSMHMTYMRHPLGRAETLEDLQKYPYPDFLNGDSSHQKKQVEEIKNRDLIALGDMQMTIWEIAWYMRGLEELFLDMIEDSNMATFLFDMTLDMAKIRAKSYVEAGVDVIFFGDDIGMQNSIMMSEEMYCKWLKPRLKELIDYVKSINPNVIVFYHSCGFIEPFIPHLIETGIDVLNPIQTECMDYGELHSKYGDVISFHGTIGTQVTMPKGTPEEVKKEVCENLDISGEKGGLMVAPTHMLEPDVPLENVLAYVEACRSYIK